MALDENLNGFFDHIFCINLDRRPDKWELCKEEFMKWHMEVERFSAIDGKLHLTPDHRIKAGALGNCMSKMGVIKIAQKRKYDSVLILEDDVEFAPDFNGKFKEWSKEVPNDWDMLWLGGNHNLWNPNDYSKVDKYSPHLIRITNTYATHAFALRKTVFGTVLSALEPLYPEDDIILASLQKMCQAFSFMPNLASQKAGISDVHDIYTDYSFLRNYGE